MKRYLFRKVGIDIEIFFYVDGKRIKRVNLRVFANDRKGIFYRQIQRRYADRQRNGSRIIGSKTFRAYVFIIHTHCAVFQGSFAADVGNGGGKLNIFHLVAHLIHHGNGRIFQIFGFRFVKLYADIGRCVFFQAKLLIYAFFDEVLQHRAVFFFVVGVFVRLARHVHHVTAVIRRRAAAGIFGVFIAHLVAVLRFDKGDTRKIAIEVGILKPVHCAGNTEFFRAVVIYVVVICAAQFVHHARFVFHFARFFVRRYVVRRKIFHVLAVRATREIVVGNDDHAKRFVRICTYCAIYILRHFRRETDTGIFRCRTHACARHHLENARRFRSRRVRLIERSGNQSKTGCHDCRACNEC